MPDLLWSNGGKYASNIASSTQSSNVQIATGPGRLCKVAVLVSNSAAISFYDSAGGTAAGTLLFSLPANASIGLGGVTYDAQVPFALGLVGAQSSNGPAVIVGYTF